MTDPLAFLCAVLSPFTSQDELLQLRRSAAQGKVDWVAVAGYANRDCLAPALCVSLERAGLSAKAPEMLRGYLQEIHRFNVSRNEALLQQLREVVQLLNGVGVTPLLLKGGAALVTDIYPDPGMRFMLDLDLLVPEERLQESVTALRDGGYEVPEKYLGLVSKVRHHYPPLIRPGAPASVELHRRLLSKGKELLESGVVWRENRPYEGCRLPGLSAALIAPTDEIVYCFAHSELGHDNHRHERIDARYLLQFAYLVCCYRQEIDWERLETLKHHARYGRIFVCYLYLAQKLFLVNLPIAVDPDPYVERYYHRVTSALNHWGRLCRLLRVLSRELCWIFSKERLQDDYQQEDVSLARLRHLRSLLGRYWRIGAWKKRFSFLKQR